MMRNTEIVFKQYESWACYRNALAAEDYKIVVTTKDDEVIPNCMSMQLFRGKDGSIKTMCCQGVTVIVTLLVE